MAEQTKKPTERLKDQPKDETKKTLEIKQLKDETKKNPQIKQSKEETKKTSKVQSKVENRKIPEIKVQPTKSSSKESYDVEHKTRISRNVALNRSFNSNSKLELLR